MIEEISGGFVHQRGAQFLASAGDANKFAFGKPAQDGPAAHAADVLDFGAYNAGVVCDDGQRLDGSGGQLFEISLLLKPPGEFGFAFRRFLPLTPTLPTPMALSRNPRRLFP